MERFVNGQIIVADFPFSDAEEVKKRPALVIAKDKFNAVLCKISATANEGIELKPTDLEKGRMNRPCRIVPSFIMTIRSDRIDYILGKLKKEKYDEVMKELQRITEFGI